ncbi:hypothetical protein [Microscilla marina]|uniref:Uncharacterized protein n=1 Tax=Microscilla marina ATCC 23134 TaxID=313606 RepID=A1ZVT0_MICM2|nr:hypothetical protein [Microscilla marina]EAY25507.1 hypothetical protein M23134_06206 [Microscilla marina ATCC 23134]
MNNLQKRFEYTPQNIARGAIVYALGDCIAAFILGEFAWLRLLGMMLVGATLYAFEIPNYFRWIARKVGNDSSLKASFQRTALALLYFNPLWIARHLVLIKLVSGNAHLVGGHLLGIAFWSFIVNIPVSIVANYVIQNKIPLQWRFLASAIFSGLMAVYYALSELFFQ